MEKTVEVASYLPYPDLPFHREADVAAIDTAGRTITDTENTGWGFAPGWMLVTLLSVPLVAGLFWWLGTYYFGSRLQFFEYQQFTVVVAGIIAGGYQLYFWVQRNSLHKNALCMKISLDDLIPFWPRWVWFYSLLYYVMIGLTVISIRDLAEGIHLIYGGLMLLASGAAIFYFFPTEVPESFRQFKINSRSTRYLAFIQSMDNNRNAFPSMHCAIAAYIGLAVIDLPLLGPWLGYGFIGIITISCVVVKQHVIVDTLFGLLLGVLVFYLNQFAGVSAVIGG